jgi:hypothetical protein
MNDWSGCCPAPGEAATSRAPPDGDDTLAELLLRLSVDMDTPSLHQNVNFYNDVSVAKKREFLQRRFGCKRQTLTCATRELQPESSGRLPALELP